MYFSLNRLFWSFGGAQEHSMCPRLPAEYNIAVISHSMSGVEKQEFNETSFSLSAGLLVFPL